MEQSPSVSVTSEGLRIGNEIVPLYSGTVHYWRHERENWKRILEGVREMGFHYVETYLPWNVHEITPGQFDFGQIDPKKDAVAFIKTCQETGLFLLARPGPHINAELADFGFPRRIVDDPAIQARTVSGAPAVLPYVSNPFAIPSYASEAFYGEVGHYFDALIPLIKPFIYPAGPIVAYQADNENSFFFRMHCFDVDYHPDSIRLYQEFLKSRYQTIRRLNQIYHQKYSDFSAVEPPRSFEAAGRTDLPYYLDWAAYQEYYINYGITRVAKMLAERGMQRIPCFHNLPTFYPSEPFNMSALEEKIDIAGVDAYPQLSQYHDLKLGVTCTSTTSRLPFIPEFMSGAWSWYRPLSAVEERFITQTVFMYGIRAINYYMLAERDRWMGCPIQRDGTRRDDYFDLYTRWNACLKKLAWHKLRPERKILLLTSRTYDRLKYISREAAFPQQWLLSVYTKLPDDLFESERTLGERDNIAAGAAAWILALRTALEALGESYAISDSDISAEKLAEYSLVIAPTFDWADKNYLDKLAGYVKSGGKLLCGPRWPVDTLEGEASPFWQKVQADLLPYANPQEKKYAGMPVLSRALAEKGWIMLLGKTFPTPGELEPGSKVYLEAAGWVDTVLAEAGIVHNWQSNNPNVDATVLSGGGRRVVCVTNPTDTVQEASLSVIGAIQWQRVKIWAEEPATNMTLRSGESLVTKLAPWSVQVWEVS